MNVKKPLALIDMDGTLCDFNGALREAMKELASPGESLPADSHTISPWLGARRHLIKSQPGFWLGLQPLPVDFAILHLIKEMGFDCHVLSKGPNLVSGVWMEKLQWCGKHIPGIPVTVTQDKSLIYGRVLVDDWPPYIVSWLDHRPRGLVIILAQPWNDGFSHSNAIRCDGTQESIEEVRKRLHLTHQDWAELFQS